MPGGQVLVVDFGRAQTRGGLLAHFHRHGHVAIENIESLLTNADFTIVRTGSVGLRDLQFVLAKTRVKGELEEGMNHARSGVSIVLNEAPEIS